MTADEIVREIERDRKRGATALAERALDALAKKRSAARRLVAARPAMPVIAAAVRRAQKVGVARARRELRESTDRIVLQAVRVLPPGARYIVWSSSGTVDAVLKAVKAKRVKSFPADVALVGADAVYPNGDFVNARGTADFIRKAREARCGTFAVASSFKRVKKAVPLEAGFERVNGRLVHAILTETGLVYPPSVVIPGIDPTWIDRGALNPHGGQGRCHPHH